MYRIFLAISAESISKNVIEPFLKSAYDIVSIIGGLALWALIIMSIVKLIESKLGPTGWYRSAAMTGLFELFKRFLIAIAIFYVITYIIAYIMSSMGTTINPTQLATNILLNMLFKPFTTLYKYVISTGK